jgi:hypothetical protein
MAGEIAGLSKQAGGTLELATFPSPLNLFEQQIK